MTIALVCWRSRSAACQRSPRQQIEALFEGIAEQIANPQFRGCPFINLATEFPDRKHPGTAIACTNKMEVRRRLRILARALNARNPRRLGDQLAQACGEAVTDYALARRLLRAALDSDQEGS